MRRGSLAGGLVFLATILWGAWFGGQLFNALMVVPYFSASPPGSLLQWGAMRRHFVADFFVVCNSFWIFVLLAAALILGRRSRWVIASTVAALVSFGMLFWMVPLISGVVTRGGPLGDLERWTVGNWVRLAVELVGFVCALAALALDRVPTQS